MKEIDIYDLNRNPFEDFARNWMALTAGTKGHEMKGFKLYDTTEKIKQIKTIINTADAIVIGAGAGLSTSAGFTYSGERFHKYFSDFEEKYGFHDMYSGGFYPYNSLEEYWAYWSRYVYVKCYIHLY